MKISNKVKTVDIHMVADAGEDFTADFFKADSLKYDERIDTYFTDDIDSFIEQAENASNDEVEVFVEEVVGTIKAYNSNATVFCDGNWLDIRYDADTIGDYTFDENMDDIRDKIVEKLGYISNINEILTTIGIYVDARSKSEDVDD